MPALAAAQRQEIADYREALRQELANLRTRIAPPAGNRISLKGRVFTLPDGSTHPGPIAAVVLDWRNSHRYWPQTYDPNQLADPVCFALSREFDALAPHPESPEPQAARCAICPKNVFGTAPNGKAKACKGGRRLAIVPPDADADAEPMLLDVSPTAISSFESYVLGLATEGKMPVEVVTHIGFKPDADYPSLLFAKPKPLTDRQLAVMIKLRAKAQAVLDAQGPSAGGDGDVPW